MKCRTKNVIHYITKPEVTLNLLSHIFASSSHFVIFPMQFIYRKMSFTLVELIEKNSLFCLKFIQELCNSEILFSQLTRSMLLLMSAYYLCWHCWLGKIGTTYESSLEKMRNRFLLTFLSQNHGNHVFSNENFFNC